MYKMVDGCLAANHASTWMKKKIMQKGAEWVESGIMHIETDQVM